jgi:hypothetical protein
MPRQIQPMVVVGSQWWFLWAIFSYWKVTLVVLALVLAYSWVHTELQPAHPVHRATRHARKARPQPVETQPVETPAAAVEPADPPTP